MSSTNPISPRVPSLVASNSAILRQRAVEVPPGEQVGHIVAAMWRILEDHGGIGLAANQIGELRRIIIVKADGVKLTLINPRITSWSDVWVESKEGCLSFPGVTVTKMRHEQITVEGLNYNLKPIKKKLIGLAARVVQHEIDHLDGKVIGD